MSNAFASLEVEEDVGVEEEVVSLRFEPMVASHDGPLV